MEEVAAASDGPGPDEKAAPAATGPSAEVEGAAARGEPRGLAEVDEGLEAGDEAGSGGKGGAFKSSGSSSESSSGSGSTDDESPAAENWPVGKDSENGGLLAFVGSISRG